MSDSYTKSDAKPAPSLEEIKHFHEQMARSKLIAVSNLLPGGIMLIPDTTGLTVDANSYAVIVGKNLYKQLKEYLGKIDESTPTNK